MNAPEAGVLREFFANEEDTVVVGQDLVRIEVGAQGEAPAKPAESEAPKEAPKEEAKPAATESKPEAPKAPEPSKPAPAPEKKAAPPKQSSEPATPSPLGSREERRVSPALRSEEKRREAVRLVCAIRFVC